MPCENCIKNWMLLKYIGVEELSLATEQCRVCKRNDYKLFEPHSLYPNGVDE